MQLKRLEAYGFKSFAERIVVEFDRGITAVVGPNGTGKSNITDAVRWVLGEQNIRMLRGLRSEDIIFSGSAARRALSVAEVVLVFDNRDKTLPIDYEEVVVKRRLYRSGDSEVYLNGSRCRIKDIYRLFADTGIGHDGMSIIGQNRLNDILDSRPEERRVFFEETAGITKYRTRKQEALRKLRDNDSDLVRLSDIMYAQAAELEPLAAQAEKTKTYRTLEAERRQYLMTALIQEHDNLLTERESLDRTLHSYRDEEASLIGERMRAEEKKGTIEEKVRHIDDDIEELEKNSTKTREALDALQQESATLAGRQDQGIRRKEDIERLQQSSRTKIDATRQEITQIEHSLSGKIAARDVKQQACARAREKLDEILRQHAAYEERASRAKYACSGVARTVARLREELAVVSNNFEREDEGGTRRREELARRKAVLTETRNALKKAESHVRELEEKHQRLLHERDHLAYVIEESQSETHAVEDRILHSDEELRRTLQRFDFVRKLQESYEGFGKDVQLVLQADEKWRDGVFGVVADLIGIPQRYLTAVEAALGGTVRNIVTKDARIAKEAISYLKQNSGGRVTFLPLSTIAVRQPREINLRRMRGAVGWANTLVTVEESFQKVADHLLSQTLVMETLEDALLAAKENGYRIRIVTLTGELLNPGGSLTGGGRRRQQSFLLNRRHEMETLETALNAQKIQYGELQEQLKERKSLLEDNRARYSSIHEEEEQSNRVLLEERGKCDVLRARLMDQEASVYALECSEHAERENSAKFEREKIRLERNLAQCGVHEERFSKELEEAENRITALSSDVQAHEKQIHELEVECAALNAEIQTGTDHVKTRELECREAAEMLGGFTEQIARLSEELSEAGKRLDILEVAISEKGATLQDYSMADRSLKDRRLQYEAEARLLDGSIKDSIARTDSVRGKIHESDKQLDRIHVRISDCRESLLSEFGMTPEAAAQETEAVDGSLLSERLRELGDAIQSLGSVNPNAVEEYAEKKARYEEEEAQIRDLQTAKEDIERIIQKIDTDMTRTFRDAFQQIQGYFNETFVRLFGGGAAELRLTDQDDILSSGVEILVTLPHKKRQNLSALSGGERALTVIALLFSFLRYRPSPFSILDEIDAPLDEVNVSRFGDFLQEFAHDTQFIVVTHRKGTMRAADSMYGVTVEDAGVSKVLSIRLKDYEEGASA
ncbi:chromosome segregation protein SMC [Selenomonas sp. F0473]|uniref:chromosome segregation protein SMC n=1 Tax=Selenomonas sp. F0473 TaxID=999423 RepID=UPI0026006E39|nr:chromosome segregation protein SMC [Selenomonas sp. F0473]